ncbi:hypothetical protein SAMN02745130_01834 [Thiothrix eikelboomii]|uniref:Uncharacterized protein n=1 Tax=Thiothrix eikelboomii TaxID=92487 RepID=A0A1T4WMP4_9GAMM|nr:helix-hairpin-helix domain-containing protein [Thiothrix eikelboomii]SKA78145.1 hypothetical protein SAMN02745130_01834 [Thiothrix eikelboomii]
MNETSNQTYTFGTASFEILLLLVAAFLVGALVCYLLKKMGLCCKNKAVIPTTLLTTEDTPELIDPVAQMRARINSTAPTASYPPPLHSQMPKMEHETLYEADLRSLLKGRSSEETTPPSNSPPANRPTVFPSRVSPAAPPKATQTTETTIAPLVLPAEDHVDDLKKLEGIGPKIEKLLNEAGIKSYVKLATMDRDTLKAILDAGGSQFKLHEPKSWPYQAELAAKQNWQRLKEYQDFLISGRNS